MNRYKLAVYYNGSDIPGILFLHPNKKTLIRRLFEYAAEATNSGIRCRLHLTEDGKTLIDHMVEEVRHVEA